MQAAGVGGWEGGGLMVGKACNVLTTIFQVSDPSRMGRGGGGSKGKLHPT